MSGSGFVCFHNLIANLAQDMETAARTHPWSVNYVTICDFYAINHVKLWLNVFIFLVNGFLLSCSGRPFVPSPLQNLGVV